MPRIIPSELNRRLRREYKLRFFSLLFIALSNAILIGLLLVSSSYFLLSLYEKAYEVDNTNGGNDEVTELNESYLEKVSRVHALIGSVPSEAGGADIRVADKLFVYGGSAVQISSIEILPSNAASNVTVRGTALTREDLLRFQESIQGDPAFVGFTIPIDSLTKQKDISFSVTFTYNEN